MNTIKTLAATIAAFVLRRAANKPTIYVDLSGEDGNIFALTAQVRRLLVAQGRYEEAADLPGKVVATTSYESALEVLGRYVVIVDVSKHDS